MPVTFDSGGISIKPSSGMGDMKADMSGGAAVAMATIAVARNGLKANVATLVPLVENMPSGTATRPGDVYKALNGLTVEARRNFFPLIRNLISACRWTTLTPRED